MPTAHTKQTKWARLTRSSIRQHPTSITHKGWLLTNGFAWLVMSMEENLIFTTTDRISRVWSWELECWKIKKMKYFFAKSALQRMSLLHQRIFCWYFGKVIPLLAGSGLIKTKNITSKPGFEGPICEHLAIYIKNYSIIWHSTSVKRKTAYLCMHFKLLWIIIQISWTEQIQ